LSEVRILLDTHILLWWLDDSKELSARGRQVVSDPSSTIFYSAATVWEIRIKEKLGKLTLPRNFLSVLDAEPLEKLPISIPHAYGVADLPDIHRDPFDRMLISQVIIEDLTLVTHDRLLEKYKKASVMTV
jgi:PIN domain nuclease of toxin-antitoxin system